MMGGLRFFARLLIASGLVCWVAGSALAAEFALKLYKLPGDKHAYYHELISSAMTAQGHTVTIEALEPVPQPRIVAELEAGNVTLYWFLATDERDKLYVPVGVNITNGLIGKRVMLVPKGQASLYAQVKNVNDLQALDKIGAFGNVTWFDVEVWKASGLKFYAYSGEWNPALFKLVAANRGADYFPRGLTEVLAEASLYPELEIEPKLLLVYDRDQQFYLAKDQEALRQPLADALNAAKSSGLIDQLVNKHFGTSLTQLQPDTRVAIQLTAPAKSQ